MATGSDAGNSGWVASDDWYVRIEVAWNSNETSCTYTATVKVYSRYWTNRNSGVKYNINIAGNQKSGTVGSPGITPGNWATIATHSATVYRNHTSQTFAIGGWVGASSGSSSYTSGATAWWPASSHPLGALSSYAVTFNANGGSNAPGAQTKWYNETLALTSSTPTRDGHTFKGWATSSGGSVVYAPGASYTANSAITLYAVWQVWTYTVSYNANNGSGAPGNQTKTWGQNLTLSSTKPTRSLYNFKGWGTSSGSTSASYQPGGTYSSNANITLYAVWEVAWVAPRITNVSIYRSDANKTASDDGECITVKFAWKTDNAVQSINVNIGGTDYAVDGSGTSGTVDKVFEGFSSENTYAVKVTVTDTVGGSSTSATVSSAHYIMDFSKVGAVALNGVANSTTRRFDVNMPQYWSDVAKEREILGLENGYMSRRYPITGATGTAKLIVWLGTWSGSADSNNCILEVHSGDGYNGRYDQNATIRIQIKNGWQSTASTTAAFGVTCLNGGSGEGMVAAAGAVDVRATAHDTCNVYMTMPWPYFNGDYVVVSCTGGTWTHKNQVVTSKSGVSQPIGNYYDSFNVGRCLSLSASTIAVAYPARLWSGTLNKGGSITVSNLNNYRVLGVVTNAIDEAGIMLYRSDSIYGTCGFSHDNGTNTYTYTATFKKNSTSGNVLTLVSASRHLLMANGTSGESLSVTRIWGII